MIRLPDALEREFLAEVYEIEEAKKMLDQPTQDEIVRRVVEALHPERIILFGSHAWGTPTSDSDVDLFVIIPETEEPAYRLASRAHRALRGLRVPVDFIIRSRFDVDSRKNVPAAIEHEILSKGRFLYG